MVTVAAAALLLLAGGTTSAQNPSSSTRPSFEDAARIANSLPRLRSLLVSWRGDLVLEHHAKGVRADRPANVKSVSKSIVATLVGIALEKRLIPGLDTPLATYYPELRRDPDPRKASITVEDLLTMRSGLESTSGEAYGAWVRSRNWVRYVLTRPMVSAPGTSMEYSTGTSHLLSAILTKVSGRSTWALAHEWLGRPLGFTFARWPRDPQGIYFGGNEMLMTPRQMVAFGELHRRRGRAGTRQVVPAAWVDTSCVPRTVSRWDPGREYGYGWWIDEIGGHEACFAWGFGGQYILVFRDLELVVAVTSTTDAGDDRWRYRDALLDLIASHVVRPVAAVTSPPAQTR